jgi:hypothetical protein
VRTVRAASPQLNRRLNSLPEPRCLRMCLYSAAHMWWGLILMFLCRLGSRNAFDEKRLSGQAPWNMGALCGQSPDDPRFQGRPTITCSDNAAGYASRVDPQEVAEIPLSIMRDLLERRMFEGSRLFDHWYVLFVDGSVKEKCRQGFAQGGKSSTGQARYRYVLQCSLKGLDGTLFPFMHEEMDMQNPETEKEDCELNAFSRLSQRLKEAFPRLAICVVGDSLYCCQAVVAICKKFDWKYVLTLKEGRQPTTWEETIKLLPLHRTNRLRVCLGTKHEDGLQDFRWVEDVMLGEHQTNVILQGEITPQPSATLYAYITNFSKLTPQRVAAVVNSAGRERHLIEDAFNAQKNNGIGLEHVFCADATASKNYYTMMQVAQILWNLTCHGNLRRLYGWARRATEKGLARAVWEGLRAERLPPDLPPLGQIRFGFG